MNLYHELDKLTAPAPVASAVRILSSDEIESLQSAGMVTDIREIPQFHHLGRVSHPPYIKKTSYSLSLDNSRGVV